MPRVPITYKVKGETKREIDLLSATLGLEKTEVVEAAVSELFQRCRSEVAVYLDRMRAAVQGRGTDSLADVLNRKPWPKDYSGRAVEK